MEKRGREPGAVRLIFMSSSALKSLKEKDYRLESVQDLNSRLVILTMIIDIFFSYLLQIKKFKNYIS